MATAQKIGPKNGFISQIKANDTPTSMARKVRVSSFAYISNIPEAMTFPANRFSSPADCLNHKGNYHDTKEQTQLASPIHTVNNSCIVAYHKALQAAISCRH